MSATTDPKRGGFQLSQLIYDTRYRSMTIQIVALVFFLLGLGWFLNNAAQNLAALDKGLSFGFLGEAAGYDVNQKLVEYHNQMSHGRAALVGVLNTLLVAVLGCILATFLGVIIGVLRLSNNWVVARIMTFYIEMFRNVPVLLWIVLAMAIFIENLPAPKSFRGDDASMWFSETVAVTNQGIFIPRIMGTDYWWLFGVAIVVSVFFWRGINKWASDKQDRSGLRPSTWLIRLVALLLPVLVVYFATTAFTSGHQRDFLVRSTTAVASLDEIKAGKRPDLCFVGGSTSSLNASRVLEKFDIKYRRKKYVTHGGALEGFISGKCSMLSIADADMDQVMADVKENINGDGVLSAVSVDFTTGRALQIDYPALPAKGIPRFEGGTHIRGSLIALTLALALYTAAFIAEIVRAGIMAINKGQSEAAFALGLRPNRTMNLVVLPQALRVIIPPLISNYLNLTKNSSLAIAVGYMDITGTLGGITLNQTGREMESLLILMAIYLAISLTISSIMNWYNESVKLRER